VWRTLLIWRRFWVVSYRSRLVGVGLLWSETSSLSYIVRRLPTVGLAGLNTTSRAGIVGVIRLTRRSTGEGSEPAASGVSRRVIGRRIAGGRCVRRGGIRGLIAGWRIISRRIVRRCRGDRTVVPAIVVAVVAVTAIVPIAVVSVVTAIVAVAVTITVVTVPVAIVYISGALLLVLLVIVPAVVITVIAIAAIVAIAVPIAVVSVVTAVVVIVPTIVIAVIPIVPIEVGIGISSSWVPVVRPVDRPNVVYILIARRCISRAAIITAVRVA